MKGSSRSDEQFTVQERTVNADGRAIPVRDYTPTRPASRTAFFWVHGGGFTSGGLDQRESDAPARRLAAAGRRVRTVDYRLAPRANPFKEPKLGPAPGRYPSGLDDVVAVAESFAHEVGGPIALGGASAGADLAAATILRLRDAGKSLPTSVVLAYGTLHAVLPFNDEIESQLRGPLARWAFNPSMLRAMNLNYVGDPALLVPGYAFPGGGDLTGFPPTLVMDARNDRLRLSGHAFADELRAARSPVRQVVVPASHGFLGMTRSKAFQLGVREIADWLAKHDD